MTKSRNHAVALLLGASALQAQGSSRPLFTRNDVYWGAAFLLGSIALSTVDVQIARKSTDSSIHSTGLDKFARNFSRVQEGTLTVGNLALWGIARLAKAPNMADITFHAAESVVVGSIASQIIRGPLGRSRPFITNYEDQYDFHPFRGFTNFNYRAFPSIHTSSSFAVATVYTLETRRRAPDATWVVGPVTYLLAAGPGLARLYNGQHWASDLLAGAFMGVLAGGKVVRYNHEVNPRNAVNRFFLGDNAVRLSYGADGVSISYSMTF